MSFILVLVFFLSFTSVLSTKDDGYMLLKMKKQLHNPEILSSWVKGFDFCNLPWMMGSSAVNVMCENNRVVILQIYNVLDIRAPFPDAICNLTALRSLEINHIPGLRGSIPSCIANLSGLSSVTIVETSLTGFVPSFSTNMNMMYINMSSNHLSGPIPSSLSNLPNLLYLELSANYLNGSIPPGIFPQNTSHFIGYPSLVLFNNNLTGEIPFYYGSVHFMGINVKNNQLSGNPSFLFGFDKFIESIILANNHFKFDFSHVEIPKLLQIMDLSHNEIYGNVPSSFATDDDLWDPNLSFNKLCGELPQGMNMEKFGASVFVNNTCLCGYPLPPCHNSGAATVPPTRLAPAPEPISAPYAWWNT